MFGIIESYKDINLSEILFGEFEIKCYRNRQKLVEEILTKLHLTYLDWIILSYASKNYIYSEICSDLKIKRHTLSEHVRKLKNKGLLDTGKNLDDAYGKFLYLTAKGYKIHKKANTEISTLAKRITKSIGIEQFVNYLEVQELISKWDNSTNPKSLPANTQSQSDYDFKFF